MALREEGYWDKHYELELRNYEEHGDEGEVWFGRGLSRRIANWVVKNLKEQPANQPVQLIDIGCGNGFFLKTLFEYLSSSKSQANLHATGIDYSQHSVELSKKIVDSSELQNLVTLDRCDFLDREQVNNIASKHPPFDFLVDIGTYDAICLLANKSDTFLQEAKLKYMTSVYSLAHKSSVFILASCNHTEDELMSLFALDCQPRFEAKLIDRIETPKLQFGGREGSQVTCLILQFTELH